jgi:hypothetical protein
MGTSDFSGRALLVDYLRAELVGPRSGDREELQEEMPHRRYTMGVLYPRTENAPEKDEAEEDETRGNGSDSSTDDPVTMAGQWLPSSIGLSFYIIGGPVILVRAGGARYVHVAGVRSNYLRRPYDQPAIEIVRDASDNRSERKILDGTAAIHVLWRPMGEHGWLVTVTLQNRAIESRGGLNPEDYLCQAELECSFPAAELGEYPSVKTMSADAEEQELQLLYRRNRIYAVGHGCSAEWDTSSAQPVSVRTQVMPMAEVAAMTHDLDHAPDILRVARLADERVPTALLIAELEGFVALYADWIDMLPGDHADIPARLLPAREAVMHRLGVALSRMNNGIDCLRRDPVSLQAFRLASRVMLMQMHHGSDELAGQRHARGSASDQRPDYLTLPNRWRPFQLAFQLLTLESVANDESPDRETADLIWFPTGGGKTEAYLAMAAFDILRRRLTAPDHRTGTTVITRYTLRLLASQQFQRAARLMCACELIRRQQPGLLGADPLTIGFWAGGDVTPNTFKLAEAALDAMRNSERPASENRFLLDSCPWCGTEMLPAGRSGAAGDYGFICTPGSFTARCTSPSCEFHEALPVSVVDQDLYMAPPTFLIGTVDKFAMLAWEPRAVAFFGGAGREVMPPSLIIQDELHLLSGPLGTLVGLYETALDGLLRLRGMRPKVIASTATIRSASEQVMSLFARPVFLFPPAGLSYDNSFFARTDTTRQGRLYVGIMSGGHRATTSVVRTAAALQQALIEVEGLAEEERDAYWTLVMYHLSLRELGKTVSFARDDIPARIKIIAEAEDRLRQVHDHQVVELTSNRGAGSIPAVLARMGSHYLSRDAISVLVSTNMFSVGVDVKRLGLMMINGQPKTTSEYIQASSRVGRDRVPGLVVTHYAASKPRDRSHYEMFLSYHQSLYRYVEPTSVTPFSLPARNRALHAALIIMMRHGGGLSRNEAARDFDPDSLEVRQAVGELLRQAQLKDPDEAERSRAQLEELVVHWESLAAAWRHGGQPLTYRRGDNRQVSGLMQFFGDEGREWPTLTSMRNVDTECTLELVREYSN